MNFAGAKRLCEGRRSGRDLVVIATLAVAVFAVSAVFDVFNLVLVWMYRHDTWQLDELFTVVLYLVVAGVVYAWRRHNELTVQMRRRENAEAETSRLIPELERALDDVATLRKIVPICSSCRRVRDTRGDWYPVDTYMEIHFLTRFNDGFCPECAREAYGQSPNRAMH
jgi:hypothetical protein